MTKPLQFCSPTWTSSTPVVYCMYFCSRTHAVASRCLARENFGAGWLSCAVFTELSAALETASQSEKKIKHSVFEREEEEEQYMPKESGYAAEHSAQGRTWPPLLIISIRRRCRSPVSLRRCCRKSPTEQLTFPFFFCARQTTSFCKRKTIVQIEPCCCYMSIFGSSISIYSPNLFVLLNMSEIV